MAGTAAEPLDGQAWWTVAAAQLGARGTAPLTLGLRLVRAADAGAAPAGPLLEVDWVARYTLPDTAADGAQSATATTSPATAGPATTTRKSSPTTATTSKPTTTTRTPTVTPPTTEPAADDADEG